MKQINKRSFVFVQSVEYVCVNKNTCLLSCFRCKLSVWCLTTDLNGPLNTAPTRRPTSSFSC